jgi:hypothetical protein
MVRKAKTPKQGELKAAGDKPIKAKKKTGVPLWITIVVGSFFCCGGMIVFTLIGQQLGFIPDSAERTLTKEVQMAMTETELFLNPPTDTITPSVTPSPTITHTPSITPSATVTPTASTTNTPAPLPTSRPSATAQPPTAAPAQTYYVTGEYARIRNCSTTDCEQVNLISNGQTVQVVGEVQGEFANGSSLWYLLADGNYVHSSTVSDTAPVQAQSNNTSSSGTGSGGGSGGFTNAPGNCATAVAAGLTAQQAAQAGLDRDNDGVACYGD